MFTSEVEKLLAGDKLMKAALTKKRFSQITILVVFAAALVLSLSVIRRSYGNVGSGAAWAGGPATVARVEGRDISVRLYEMYLKNGIQALGLTDATAEGRDKINRLKAGIVAELIDRALIEAEAERRGLVIAPDQMESRYRRRVEEMGGDDVYRAYLKESKISDEDFRRIVAGELYGEMVQQELSQDLVVAPAEAEAFYDREKANPKYRALFVAPESVRASHILINARRLQIRGELQAKGTRDQAQLDRLATEEISKRRARAAELLNQLKAGASFAERARRYSDDAGSGARGGDLGWFTRDAHTAKFDAAAFTLKPGQLSDIVETEYGFHLIYVSAHQPEHTRRFDEVRARIEQQLLARRRAERLTAWLEARRRAADVAINPSYREGHQ